MKIPPQPQLHTTKYSNFKGVDFSKDPLLVDYSHSPNAINLIADKNGMPEKRPGYKTICTMGEQINGLYRGVVNGIDTFLIHSGTKLSVFKDNVATELINTVNNAKSTGFFAQHENKSKFFLMDGKNIFVYDGTDTKNIVEIATIPVIMIAKKPSGGGSPKERINLLQPKRIEKFAGDGTTKVYQLSSNMIDSTLVTIKETLADSEKDLVETTDFTVDRASGKVTFNTAPPKSPVDGEDNIVITYAKTSEENRKMICECSVYTFYGLGGSNRVFVTGNPSYNPRDWWSDINNPTYFPDLNYSIVGNDNTKIMGYAKMGEYLVIIKEDNQQDSTIFMRTAQYNNGEATFPIKQGITGTGAISPYSFVSLVDEPLFLSRNGIYAITSNVVTAERTLRNRSFFVDARLTKESNIEKAIAVEWNGYYVLALNGHAYLLDSRQKTSVDGTNNFVYECYYWDNINANCLLSAYGKLWFGDSSGNVCEFKTEETTLSKYSDNDNPIYTVWETKADNDGLTAMLKTMQKKGGTLTVKPSIRTSAKVSISVDGEAFEELANKSFSIFSWSDLNFDLFTFFTLDNPKTIYFNQKVKKYTTLQFRIENSELNQNFGIFELTKYYTVGNFGKG